MESLLNLTLSLTLLVMIFIGALLFKQSESERRENRKLEKMNKSLTDQGATKDEFLSFATHQLRSPLTSIKWGLGALKESFSKEMVDKLLTTTDDLIGTVNDLLDISKIEQGGLVMKKEEFDLHDAVGRIVEEFRPAAEAKGLHLTFTGANTACFVKADETKLRQVFVNLVDNALKYTKTGSITVSFSATPHTAMIEVTDTGPGIAANELSGLFLKFLRGAAGKASEAGSGLGLYLAKRIVEAHAGSIEAHSDGLGKGSRFVVSIPLSS